jgi:MoxR-like ATPase
METSQMNYTYTGKIHPPDGDQAGAADDKRYPYLPDKDLIEAVNLAMELGRPLLLEGDPGCGKTCLAEALAYELGQANQTAQPWPYYRWDVKSSSRGKDGLYTFDAVGRLRDAQMLGANLSELGEFLDKDDFGQLKARLKDKREYLEFGALGKAIQEVGRRAVVLIDEVDKADSDFCNDLLLELDRYEFRVPEINADEAHRSPKDQPPIVILTSNREKPLPAPFLRRCIYFYVEFPKEKRLEEIVGQRFGAIGNTQAELVGRAIAHIGEVRELLKSKPGSRPPGTSEFLDFLAALLRRKDPEKALADLENLAQRLPLLGLLLKTEADQALYGRKYDKSSGQSFVKSSGQ